MRRHPNRRASRDHTPGPITDSATPIDARRILLQGSPHFTIRAHSANAATRHPETGVHNPTNRSPLAIIAATCRIAGSPGWATPNRFRPEAMTALPATSRRIRRPAPGQPCANVEKRRRKCTHYQGPNRRSREQARLGLFDHSLVPPGETGTSGLDNSTPDADHRRVGSVGSAEFGKNTLNATFDAVFCSR